VPDPIKLVIFIAVFAALLLLGRKLSSSDSSHAVPGPSIRPAAYGMKVDEEACDDVEILPATVGADLPFPIFVPSIEMDKDGRYNRPEFSNYYFEEIDLVRGPDDPQCFIDQFFMEVRDLRSGYPGTYRYTVATPSGLQKTLDSTHVPALAVGQQMIIVSRWDLPLILQTVVAQILKAYRESLEDPPELPLGDTEDAS